MRILTLLLLLFIGGSLLGQTKEDNGYVDGLPEINPPAFGTWNFFSWGNAPANTAGPFVFNSTNGGKLYITDAFLSGDQLEVFDNGISIGKTSVPGTTGDQIGVDYATASVDPRWSSGVMSLSAGAHSITITAIVNPFGGGAGAYQFQENAGVPTLSEWGLIILGIGFLIFGVVMIRQRQLQFNTSKI